MNKEYFYKEGKVVVIDENNNEKLVDCCDNLDDILIQENLIETMEKEIKILEEDCSKYKKKNKFLKFFTFFSPYIIGTLILFFIINNALGTNTFVNTMLFGALKFKTLFTIITSILFVELESLLSLEFYLEEKKLEQNQKGKETQLEYLRKDLIESKEKLQELRKDTTSNREKEEFSVKKVDSKEELKKIYQLLLFYYRLGYNEEQYFKCYRQGKLSEGLKNNTNEVGIMFANQYFEKKKQTLVKRKIKSNNI